MGVNLRVVLLRIIIAYPSNRFHCIVLLLRQDKNARKMFFASLLYLPVFMSGLMLHRLSDDWQTTLRNESESTTKSMTVSPSFRFEQDNGEHEDHQVQEKNSGTGARGGVQGQSRPPVAYASVAPFPFLPAPCYAES